MKSQSNVPVGILFAVLCAVVLAGTYFYSLQQRSINNLQVKDSIFTEKLNKKIFSIDSINRVLQYNDSLQKQSHIKLKVSIEKTKRDFILTSDSIGVLPEL